MQIFNLKNGPLPFSATFATNLVGGRLRIFISGTAKLETMQPGNEYIIGTSVLIDKTYVGAAQMWIDDTQVRHSFTNMFEIESPQIGRHAIALEPFKQTPSTQWDLYTLVIEEI